MGFIDIVGSGEGENDGAIVGDSVGAIVVATVGDSVGAVVMLPSFKTHPTPGNQFCCIKKFFDPITTLALAEPGSKVPQFHAHRSAFSCRPPPGTLA